jgi:hypothetical protein
VPLLSAANWGIRWSRSENSDKAHSYPAPPRASGDDRVVRLLNGAPVDTDAAGCCVGLTGAGDTYATCMTEPTTSGLVQIPETGEFAWVFACDRHAGVVVSPRPLTVDDLQEMRRRSFGG